MTNQKQQPAAVVDERAEFEKALARLIGLDSDESISPGLLLLNESGAYRDGDADAYWKVWQARAKLNAQPAPVMSRDTLLQAIARGWCAEGNKHKEMDTTLALAIADEIEKIKMSQPAPAVPAAAEVFAAFDKALIAEERETWTGPYKAKGVDGIAKRREAWAKVAELRAMLVAAPEPKK